MHPFGISETSTASSQRPTASNQQPTAGSCLLTALCTVFSARWPMLAVKCLFVSAAAGWLLTVDSGPRTAAHCRLKDTADRCIICYYVLWCIYVHCYVYRVLGCINEYYYVFLCIKKYVLLCMITYLCIIICYCVSLCTYCYISIIMYYYVSLCINKSYSSTTEIRTSPVP